MSRTYTIEAITTGRRGIVTTGSSRRIAERRIKDAESFLLYWNKDDIGEVIAYHITYPSGRKIETWID